MPKQFEQDNHFKTGLAPELKDTTNLDPSTYIRQMSTQQSGQTRAETAGQQVNQTPASTEARSGYLAGRMTGSTATPVFPLLSFLLSLGFAWLLRTLATDPWRFMYPYSSKGSWLSDIYLSLGQQSYHLLFWAVLGICLLFALVLALHFWSKMARARRQGERLLDIFTLFLFAAIIYCAWPAFELFRNSSFFN